MTADPFGTAALRRAVLDAWRASPTRRREDANLEDDHARGYYRDRVVVELAQNAADAAARAGVAGRVTFRLDTTTTPATLRVGNAGAPLDAAGVASLASLRASSKGEGAVGRFGVGFAAVRSVSDDVTLRSTTGGVRFSAALTRAELEREGVDAGRAALLRLPFPAPGVDGDTVVEIVLRDADAVAAVCAQLDAVDDALLLALPTLERVEIEVRASEMTRRVLDAVGDRWVTHRAEGHLAAADVAELPVEQRRTAWSLVWALPRAAGGFEPSAPGGAPRVPRVLHAPTPTDVPLTFPALLVASFPVDPGRRRVLPGAATDALAVAAGRAYAGLLAGVADERGTGVLDLVPGDLPAGELDAAIREPALEALASTPLLPRPGGPAGDPATRVAPRDAVVVAGPVGDDDDVAALLGTVPLPARRHATARRLGAQVVPLADALDEVAGLPPAAWRAVYASLAPHVTDAAVREALAGAPVPLADGRLARGSRGLVLPGPSGSAAARDAAKVLGVRVVHPDAAHPVLERVGATAFDAGVLLADPAVRTAALGAAESLIDAEDAGDVDGDAAYLYDVADLGDAGSGDADLGDADLGDAGAGDADLDDVDDDAVDLGDAVAGPPRPRAVVDAVLALVAAVAPEAVPFWVGELPVRADGGMPTPLRETALPGTWAAEHLDGLAVVDDDEVARHGEAVLQAAGAHATLDVYRVGEAVTGEADDDRDADSAAAWLPDWQEYLEHLADQWGPDVLVDDVEAVADLDAVAEGSWPQALALVAQQPDLRRALLTPVRPGTGARPGAGAAPSYTAWWLRRSLGAPFALHDRVPLLPPAPAVTRGLDDTVLRALGGVGNLAEQRAEDWPSVLDALGPVGTAVAVRDALALWAGLAAAAVAADPADRATLLDPLPDRLPALRDEFDVPALRGAAAGAATVVADAGDVVVAPGRRWAQLGPVIPAPSAAVDALADLLDLPVAPGRAPDDAGDPRTIDARVRALDPRIPAVWRCHDVLTVGGVRVRFWAHDGEPHAIDEASLADALADLVGAPSRAALLRDALARPGGAAALWGATAWDAPTSGS